MLDSNKSLLICVFAHKEGELLKETLVSTLSSVDNVHGIRLETLIVLDRPDSATRRVAYASGFRYIELDFGDVGASRNHCLREHSPRFDFLVFLDGDDLWGGHWLESAVGFAIAQDERVPLIVVPKTRSHFWLFRNHVLELRFRQPDCIPDSTSVWSDLAKVTHLWSSTFLINRSAASMLSFRLEINGYLFEDWWFSNDSLEAGVFRKAVPGIHHYRQTGGSRRRLQMQHMQGQKPTYTFLGSRGDSPKWLEKLFSLFVLLLLFRSAKLYRNKNQLLEGWPPASPRPSRFHSKGREERI